MKPRWLLALSLAAAALSGCADTQRYNPRSPLPAPYQAALASGFRGAIAIDEGTNGPSAIFSGIRHTGPVDPASFARWPWASVTKQVLAVVLMQEVEAGRIDLDTPASTYLPGFTGGARIPTVRQLLQHRAGLRNPDDTPADTDGFPSFYSDGPTGPEWCLAERVDPTDEWRYNNCDYIVIGALLERVTGQELGPLLEERIGGPAGWQDTRLETPEGGPEYYGRDESYDKRIARYGSSGALVGTLEDMLRFDRALLEGRLLGEDALATLWNADPSLGYMALGQWVFEAPLKGCEVPVRIVERRGAIGKYQVRNIILPRQDTVLAMATEQEDFDFGEIWAGSGAMYDFLSAVACN
ncbi:serine hydrolase domain-containing protein [Aurantiacibacter poecillastricola]|uniref:serine hydrolase domain-containing protein n=1 Tax=Aurantiacibacter poecillastricola TaxID=3064385 RepID=UPI00273D257E|nr:serine hydrolase domain-containing protein [Aurantiacibacter sp. 219JJ12-13]MDP5261472.1 serine hydrolase domain-containing protein [Aurantiacibacter sp. 219JJ12-13]